MARVAISNGGAVYTFTLSDGELSVRDSANWGEQNGSDGQIMVVSNAFRGEYGNWTDCAYKGAGTFTANQYFEFKVTGTWGADTDYIGGNLRNNGSSFGSDSMYRVVWQPSLAAVQVYKVVNHTPTQIGSNISVTFAANDLFSADAVTNGSNVDITAYKNGVSLATRSDTSSVLSTGKPGVTGKNHDNATFGDDWVGGNITASGGFLSSNFWWDNL